MKITTVQRQILINALMAELDVYKALKTKPVPAHMHLLYHNQEHATLDMLDLIRRSTHLILKGDDNDVKPN